MYSLMCYKIALLTECLFTYFTTITLITTMQALMSCKITLLTEYLITCCAAIRAITTMYAPMCHQSALFTKCLITYFTAIKAFTIMYITGRSAFSTLYMNLFILRTLVKTQRLNIRIYSDRKAINLIVMFTLNKWVKICCRGSKLCAIELCVSSGYICIYKVTQKNGDFEETGSALKKNPTRQPRSAHNPQNIEAVCVSLLWSPWRSVRKLTAAVRLSRECVC